MTIHHIPVDGGIPAVEVDCDAILCDAVHPGPIAEPWLSLTVHGLPGSEPPIKDFCGRFCLEQWVKRYVPS